MPVLNELKPKPENSVFLMIDIQERLFNAMPEKAREMVLMNASILLNAAKLFDLPVVYFEQYPKGLLHTLAPLQELLDGEPVEKLDYNLANMPDFIQQLDGMGKTDVILWGMEAHICVLQSAVGLMDKGYRVFVPADAVCSRSKFNWKLGLESMRRAGVQVGSTEMFLFMMYDHAGTEFFKKLSVLVK